MPSAATFATAFKRNCPHVRMTAEEGEELWRLFRECQKDAEKAEARRIAALAPQEADDADGTD